MAEEGNDQKLVQFLQKGNITAFDSLFEVYSPKLFGFALKYFKNESDAEELVQEVFVKVCENHRTLKSELSFKSYLFTIECTFVIKSPCFTGYVLKVTKSCADFYLYFLAGDL